jgi:putative transport protein
MSWFAETLRHYPELAIFLALGIGYFVGPFHIGSLQLGNVTASLLAGVLVGQMNIPISPPLKGFVFLLFLFAIGYKVGPQFFAGLKKDGLAQIVFAVFAALVGLAAVASFAAFVHFNVGQAAGLLAGSLTQSPAIGTATDALSRLGLDASVFKTLQDQIAVGYAVTYVLATVTGVVTCSRVVPWMFRFDLAAECRALEAQMGVKPELAAGAFRAYAPNSARAFKLADAMAGRSVGEIERAYEDSGHRVFVAAIRRGGTIAPASSDDVLASGDVIALAGSSEAVVSGSAGTEVHDPELLDIPLLELDAVVTNSQVSGLTVEALVRGRARGVVLQKISRAGIDIPVLPLTTIERGDTLKLAGLQNSVEAAAAVIGYPLRPSPGADIVFVSLAILIGGLVGSLSIKLGGAPISFGTSGGALVAGLVAGYLRERSPTFGNISPGAQWVFDSFALTAFVAVVGIEAGPGFASGMKAAGLEFIAGGILVPVVTLLLAALFGRYVLRLNNVILCGALAGSDTSTAALGAVQDVAKSNIVTLGYTIPYAVGNVLLTVWGTVIVALFATKTAT